MSKKDTGLPQMRVKRSSQQQLSDCGIRTTAVTQEKENKMAQSLQKVKAINFINKTKLLNSPELIFALNDSIVDQVRASENGKNDSGKEFRCFGASNKSLHAHGTLSNQLSPLLKTSQKPKFYTTNQQRDKFIQLRKWVEQKLQAIRQKSQAKLSDIMDYNQTVISYGLGEIIQSVRKRCKQEGDLLKFVWDNTFVLFENLLNILSKQIEKKDQEILRNQKQTQKIYLTNLGYLKAKNENQQKHLDMLYEKMKRIILWNRRLRDDRFKQEINRRVQQYRIDSYSAALEQSTSMLLAESGSSDCLKLAKKIVSRLYAVKKRKGMKNNMTIKQIQNDAEEYLHKNTKQFVTQWLRRNSSQDEEAIKNATFLSQDEKLDILKMSDKDKVDCVDIFDFFKTATRSVQTQSEQVDNWTQYEQVRSKRSKNVGIETIKIMKSNACIQVSIEVQTKQTQGHTAARKSAKKKITTLGSTKGSGNPNHKNAPNKGILQTNKTKLAGSKPGIKIAEGDDIKNTSGDETASQLKKNIQEISAKKLSDAESMVSEINQGFKKSAVSGEMTEGGEYVDYRHGEKLQKNSRITINDVVDEWQIEDQCPYQGREHEKTLSEANPGTAGNFTEAKNSIVQRKIYGQKYTKKSQRFISEPDERALTGYESKPLLKKKFSEAYGSQMKQQVETNKDELVRNVIRRRSFYKPTKIYNESTEKEVISLWYRPANRVYMAQKPKREFNQIDDYIFNYFYNLNKQWSIPVNFAKSKAFNQTCQLFTNVANSIAGIPRNVPKSKQFIKLSVASIIKFISRLLFDYLRKIKCEFEQISTQSERVYYPLSIILVDHMIHKYGLRDIAEKKLKDFMEKIGMFIGISQKINFFYRLFGVGDELIGADELLIYMKCLVYFDTTKLIPIMNISKDFSISRALTNRETVLAKVDLVINEFFCQKMREQIKWKVERYFHIYQLNDEDFQIERIATLVIEEFIGKKKQLYEQYLPVYKNCQGNFFPNLFKALEITSSKIQFEQKYSKMINEVFKNAELMDEIYGKSISELRFVGVCIKVGFPFYSEIRDKMVKLQQQLVEVLGISTEFTVESEELLSKLKKKYNIKISVEREAPDYWLWTCAQIAYEIPLINSLNLLGTLRLLSQPILA